MLVPLLPAIPAGSAHLGTKDPAAICAKGVRFNVVPTALMRPPGRKCRKGEPHVTENAQESQRGVDAGELLRKRLNEAIDKLESEHQAVRDEFGV